MSKKVALISGITGQDGSFLAEFLIEKGYEVHGILRRSSSFNTARIEHLYLDEWVRDMKQNRLVNLHWGDMTDSSSLIRIIQSVQPDEIYNLAAQSHVKVSFDVPEYTAEADAVGTLRMLEAVRILGLEKKTKIYQASTSKLFGLVLGESELPARLGICQRLCGMYVADSATRYARRLCYSHRRISHCTRICHPCFQGSGHRLALGR